MTTRSLDKQSLEIRRLKGNFDRYRALQFKFMGQAGIARKKGDEPAKRHNLRRSAYYEQLKAEAATSLVLDYGEIL